MEKIIEHSGVVGRIAGDTVFVKITASSACGTCQARGACGSSESQEKIVEVSTPQASSFAPGDQVVVGVHRGMGVMAVLLAYVGALVALVVTLVVVISILGQSEGAGVLWSLVAVAMYYGGLWLFRRRIDGRIRFCITRAEL